MHKLSRIEDVQLTPGQAAECDAALKDALANPTDLHREIEAAREREGIDQPVCIADWAALEVRRALGNRRQPLVSNIA